MQIQSEICIFIETSARWVSISELRKHFPPVILDIALAGLIFKGKIESRIRGDEKEYHGKIGGERVTYLMWELKGAVA